MDSFDQRAGWQEVTPSYRRRGWMASGALVGAGLLAGTILAGTLSANAAGGGGGSSVLAVPAAATSTGTATPTDPNDPNSDGPGHGWWGWWHGDGGAQVADDVAAKVKDAVLAQYSDAKIWWVRSDSDGGYDAYLETADDKHLAVHLDDAFAITGTDDLPDADGPGRGGFGWGGHRWDGSCADGSAASVPDDAAAKVKDAVVAQYPGATIWWVRSDSDGGYHAYAKTADDKAVVVHLDDAFAVTGTDDLPDAEGWWDHGGNSVSDETAAKVKDAVLAQYPGGTVPWIWSDPDDGGYHAVVTTGDDQRVVVHLDESFAITGSDSLPDC